MSPFPTPYTDRQLEFARIAADYQREVRATRRPLLTRLLHRSR